MDLLLGSVRRFSESRNKSRSLPLYTKGQKLELSAFQDDDATSVSSKKPVQEKSKRKRISSCLQSSAQSSSDDGEFDAEGTTNSDTSCSSVEFLHIPPRRKGPVGTGPVLSLPSVLEPSFSCRSDYKVETDLRIEKSSSARGSCESLSRKERLDALKARIAADRQRLKDSSEEEEEGDMNELNGIWKYRSDDALHCSSNRGTSNKSRSARTERYLKRKSQDDVALKQVSRSDPNLEFLAYSSVEKVASRTSSDGLLKMQESRSPSVTYTINEAQRLNSPAGIQISPSPSKMTWQESNAYEEPKTTSDSQLESFQVPRSTSKAGPYGFLGPFFPSTRNRPSPLTLSPVHVYCPSPSADSGLCSQSITSSPSMGRAPTPPPRGRVSSNSPSTRPPERPPSYAPSSGSEYFYNRVPCRSPTPTLQTGMNSPPWRNPQNQQKANGLPPHLPLKTNGKAFYHYTDVPPACRSTSPVVYSYTDQAPTFRPTDSHFPAYMSDSQIDSRFQPSARPSPRRPIDFVPPTNVSESPANLGEVLSDSSSSSVRTNSLSSPANVARPFKYPIIPKRPLTMLLEKTEFPNDITNRTSPLFQNGNKKCPPPILPRKNSIPEAPKTKPRSNSNYEDALKELEDIYQSLGLNDEDLLDRAERRDIPTRQQLKRFSIADPIGAASGFPLSKSSSDNFTGGRTPWPFDVQLRTTPPQRRSAVPDKIFDDFANRKLQKTPSYSSSNSPSPCGMDHTMSYLQCSPALTPGLTVKSFFKDVTAKNEPDVELDDVTYRKYTQADALRVPPPHPPFGIPLGPVAKASPSDYLHATPEEESKIPKNIYKPQQEPNVVRDDWAFRNLRTRDERKIPSSVADGALDAACRELEVWPGRTPSSKVSKKERAQRSLSANVGSTFSALDVNENPVETERAQSMTDLIAELERESKKWTSFAFGGDTEEKKNTHGSSTETLTESKIEPYQTKRLPNCGATTNKGAIYSLMSLSDIKTRKKDVPGKSPPPVPKRTSMLMLPKRPPPHMEFWSDSEAKHRSLYSDGQLEDLLSSLSASSKDDGKGEPHGVPISA